MKPTEGWLKAAEDYKRHAADWKGCCSFTDEDAEAQFMSETYGNEHAFPYTRRNSDGKFNGYAVGKHWLGVMETYYMQDVAEGSFTKFELDPSDNNARIRSMQPTTFFPYVTILSERKLNRDRS